MTGRPRVEGEREDEILDAAFELLIEVGYDRFTMDAVARDARASKATLYRRWETKPALVIDALVRAKGAPHPVDPDTGDLRSDLVESFCGEHGLTADHGTAVMGAVLTALSTDEEFAARFRKDFIEPKIALSRGLYERARDRGEIGADVDLDVIAPALAGIVLHRSFLLGVPADDSMIERIVDQVIMPAVRATKSSTSSKPTSRTRKSPS